MCFFFLLFSVLGGRVDAGGFDRYFIIVTIMRGGHRVGNMIHPKSGISIDDAHELSIDMDEDGGREGVEG